MRFFKVDRRFPLIPIKSLVAAPYQKFFGCLMDQGDTRVYYGNKQPIRFLDPFASMFVLQVKVCVGSRRALALPDF